ncbi:MAG TPA: tetratricopeptide repeat protein [Pirellulales bacterium]|nr:tetratricopeptide repeat protein [Pirellulales bacterium]
MRSALTTLVLTVILAVPVGAEETWLGQRVFWRPGATAKVGTTLVPVDTLPFPAAVEAVNGDWLWLHRAWIRKQDVATADKALADFTARVRAEPNNAVWRTCRGAILRAKGDYPGAIAEFSEAIRLDPRQVAALNNRGSALAHEGQSDGAIDDLSEAIRLDPNFAAAYLNRGAAWTQVGDYDNALRDLNEAVRLDPKDPGAWLGRGNAWAAKGDYQRAVDDLNQAIGLDSTDALAYANRGGARKLLGDYAAALKDYDQAIRLDPRDAETLAERGSVWAAQGEYEQAASNYEQALRVDRQSATAANNLAWLEATCPDAKFRDGKRAVQLATQACEAVQWQDATQLDTLAAACAEAGDFQAAVKWIEKALILAADSEKATYEAHLALYRAGKPYRDEPAK